MFVGGKLWISTAEGAKVVSSYDPATTQIDLVLGTGQNRTHMVYVTDDLKRIITSDVASATMTIIDKSAGGRGGPNWDEIHVPVGRGAEGFDVRGNELWAANAQDGTISIMDLAQKKVTQTLNANVNRQRASSSSRPTGSFRSSPFSTARTCRFSTSQPGRSKESPDRPQRAAGIEMNPDGSKAYVAAPGSATSSWST